MEVAIKTGYRIPNTCYENTRYNNIMCGVYNSISQFYDIEINDRSKQYKPNNYILITIHIVISYVHMQYYKYFEQFYSTPR